MTVDVSKMSLRDLTAMRTAAKKGCYDQITDKGVTFRPTNIKRFNTDGPGNYAELEAEGFPDPAVQPKKGEGKVVGPKPGRPKAPLKSSEVTKAVDAEDRKSTRLNSSHAQ